MDTPGLFVAIPLMDEWDHLPVLIEDIVNQTYKKFTVVFCVNQPDTWWTEPERNQVCLNNKKTIEYIKAEVPFSYTLIDKSSPGSGWKGKRHGVGWARKTAMDLCASASRPGDVILSLDGDTRFNPAYFASIVGSIIQHPGAVAVSIPYYHRLTANERADRAVLQYEIYMRYYVLNLWRIKSPYCFTALGSAMALPVKSYRAIRGMTPNKSGEDFYFLQKLRKYGPVLCWNPEKVYPAARFSDRVFFGTGPAMIKGDRGDWESHPLYSMDHFNEIGHTYSQFEELFYRTVPTPMDEFLTVIFNEKDLWQPLRENHPEKERFIRACHEKIDGLRILQYLKYCNKQGNALDEAHLIQYMNRVLGEKEIPAILSGENFSLKHATVDELDEIRNILASLEENYQYDHYNNI
jgi:hypothetical protein